MSEKYKIFDEQLPHFVTFTVVNWIDLFTRNEYREIILNSFRYCQDNKGLLLYSYCIMTNHVHVIVSSNGKYPLRNLIRDFRGFTSKELIKAIRSNHSESRRKWLIQLFREEGSKRTSNQTFQVWKRNYHPVELYNHKLLEEKVEYIHQNPVKAGFVFEPEQYVYSSASNYSGNRGLIDVVVG